MNLLLSYPLAVTRRVVYHSTQYTTTHLSIGYLVVAVISRSCSICFADPSPISIFLISCSQHPRPTTPRYRRTRHTNQEVLPVSISSTIFQLLLILRLVCLVRNFRLLSSGFVAYLFIIFYEPAADFSPSATDTTSFGEKKNHTLTASNNLCNWSPPDLYPPQSIHKVSIQRVGWQCTIHRHQTDSTPTTNKVSKCRRKGPSSPSRLHHHPPLPLELHQPSLYSPPKISQNGHIKYT